MSQNPATPGQPASAAHDAQAPGAWWAFRSGLACAFRHWPVWLLFYGTLALTAGLLLVPAARSLSSWVSHRLAAGEVATGLPGWLAAQVAGGIVEHSEAIEATRWIPLLLLSLPAWPFLLAVPATVLSAGALPVYAGSAGPGYWRRFGRGLARFSPSFLLLLFLEVSLYELALLATVLFAVLIAGLSGSLWSTLLAVPLLALVVAVVPWWFQYARTLAAAEDRRDVLQVLGRAFSFVWRNLGPAAALGVYQFLLALMPYVAYLLLSPLLSSSWWVGRAVLQQALILGLLATRLCRMAGQVAFLKSRLPGEATRQ